jgi:hypothetical protein
LLRDLGWSIFRVIVRWVVMPISALIVSIAALVTAQQML